MPLSVNGTAENYTPTHYLSPPSLSLVLSHTHTGSCPIGKYLGKIMLKETVQIKTGPPTVCFMKKKPLKKQGHWSYMFHPPCSWFFQNSRCSERRSSL